MLPYHIVGDTMRRKIKYIKFENGRSFIIDLDKLSGIKNDLDYFAENYLSDIDFSENLSISEIKTNNNIEGFLDNMTLIEKVTHNSKEIKDRKLKNRIINLYNGYKYILEKNKINKENLKVLYDILSFNLLSDDDKNKMGEFYRLEDVNIFYSSNVTKAPDKGVSPSNIDSLMDKYFMYLDDKSDINNMTDLYIKSIIAHLFFVYIHPYYDINGRSSRTTSMWYLLNNDATPYILFNRAIFNDKVNYYNKIRYSKNTGDVTNFIKYMINNIRLEFEKEYVFRSIKENSKDSITITDYSAILNILSMKGLRTLKDFTSIYNIKNEKKSPRDIYKEMICPLLEKEIIIKEKETNSYYSKENKNFIFSLNDKYIDIDKSMVRSIKL